jgi:hypothetical protein
MRIPYGWQPGQRKGELGKAISRPLRLCWLVDAGRLKLPKRSLRLILPLLSTEAEHQRLESARR